VIKCKSLFIVSTDSEFVDVTTAAAQARPNIQPVISSTVNGM
jgi:hypothetical protein